MNKTLPTRDVPPEEAGLAPCPSCGSDKVCRVTEALGMQWVGCAICGLGVTKTMLKWAIEVWNKRAPLISSHATEAQIKIVALRRIIGFAVGALEILKYRTSDEVCAKIVGVVEEIDRRESELL